MASSVQTLRYPPGASHGQPVANTMPTPTGTVMADRPLVADPFYGKPPAVTSNAPLPMTAPNRPAPTGNQNMRDQLQGMSGTMGDLQRQIQTNLPFVPNNGNPNGANNMPQMGRGVNQMRGAFGNGTTNQQLRNLAQIFGGNPPAPQYRQGAAQQPSPQRRAYLNQVSGQQGDLGRYRPPTLAGNGNDPMNWNDYGGYDYNLPSAYGPMPNTPNSQGPYGGYGRQQYPSYLQPNWMNGAGSAPRPLLPGGG